MSSANTCSPSSPISSSPLSQWLRGGWAREAEIRSVEVEGAQVRYRDWGAPMVRESDGNGGIAFVHGFLAHARWWDHIAPHFADRHHVIASDLTGMGDSDRRPRYSREQFAREIIAAVRDAGMQAVTLIAHSFGSPSTLYAAKLAPDLVRRVIILDAHVFRGKVEDKAGEVQPEKRYASREEALARYRLKPPGLWPVPEI